MWDVLIRMVSGAALRVYAARFTTLYGDISLGVNLRRRSSCGSHYKLKAAISFAAVVALHVVLCSLQCFAPCSAEQYHTERHAEQNLYCCTVTSCLSQEGSAQCFNPCAAMSARRAASQRSDASLISPETSPRSRSALMATNAGAIHRLRSASMKGSAGPRRMMRHDSASLHIKRPFHEHVCE